MERTNKLPKFMAQGSRGPLVTLLHGFLAGAGFGEGIEFDTEFQGTTVERLKDFQTEHQLEVDGCFGTESRKCAKRMFNFNSKYSVSLLREQCSYTMNVWLTTSGNHTTKPSSSFI